MTGLLRAPERVRVEQAKHLLALPERVTVHLLPEESVLWGNSGPFGVYRLVDGREVVLSDRLERNGAYGESVLPRERELVRGALSLHCPDDQYEPLVGVGMRMNQWSKSTYSGASANCVETCLRAPHSAGGGSP